MKCVVRFAREDFQNLWTHLFPGDGDEHGAVLLAGLSRRGDTLTLLVREVHLASEGSDYVEGTIGYRALTAPFIHRMITRARNERLVYLAVHNHGSDERVGFSRIDMESHERGYPALLQIAKGLPVGALVLGRRSMQADLWLTDGTRLDLDHAAIVGNTIERLSPSPEITFHDVERYERQVRLLGKAGQEQLAAAQVGIIGLGGIGSLVGECLARLGVGRFVLVDDDRIEESNLSRVVDATSADVGRTKVDVAERVILAANPRAQVEKRIADVAKESIAQSLTGCDYLFLAADSMRARLVINALVHQYLIPGVQLGSKVHSNPRGELVDVMCANRPVRPGRGCLWCNQLIDPTQLAKESKTDEERVAQAYGIEEPNPSVITLNAVAAAHAVNDFLLDYLGLRADNPELYYEHFHFLKGTRTLVKPRKDADCVECSSAGLRYARGDAVGLPCMEG
jgi:hypothetical protein